MSYKRSIMESKETETENKRKQNELTHVKFKSGNMCNPILYTMFYLHSCTVYRAIHFIVETAVIVCEN